CGIGRTSCTLERHCSLPFTVCHRKTSASGLHVQTPHRVSPCSNPQSQERLCYQYRKCLAAGDGGDDGNFRVGREDGSKSTSVTHVFFADENVDVLADLTLLVDDAIADAGMKGIEKRQGVGKNSCGLFESNFPSPPGKFAQGAWNVEGYGHD